MEGVKILRWVASAITVALLAGGCAAASDAVEKSSGAPEHVAAPTTTDYRALPLEERPEVFNPCEEISVEFLEQAGFEDVEVDPRFEEHPVNGGGHKCGWDAYPLSLVVVGAWSTLDDILENHSAAILDQTNVNGYETIVYRMKTSSTRRQCHLAIETNTGLISMGGNRSFRSNKPEVKDFDACDLLIRFAHNLMDDIERR